MILKKQWPTRKTGWPIKRGNISLFQTAYQPFMLLLYNRNITTEPYSL